MCACKCANECQSSASPPLCFFGPLDTVDLLPVALRLSHSSTYLLTCLSGKMNMHNQNAQCKQRLKEPSQLDVSFPSFLPGERGVAYQLDISPCLMWPEVLPLPNLALNRAKIHGVSDLLGVPRHLVIPDGVLELLSRLQLHCLVQYRDHLHSSGFSSQLRRPCP